MINQFCHILTRPEENCLAACFFFNQIVSWMNKNTLYNFVPLETMIVTNLYKYLFHEKTNVLNSVNLTNWLMTCLVSSVMQILLGKSKTNSFSIFHSKKSSYIFYTITWFQTKTRSIILHRYKIYQVKWPNRNLFF